MFTALDKLLLDLKLSVSYWTKKGFPTLSAITIDRPDSDREGDNLSYELVHALRDHLDRDHAVLLLAAQRILIETLGYDVTADQCESLLRLLANNSDMETRLRWNLMLVIERDGEITTDLGGIQIVHRPSGWWIEYSARQLDLCEAARTAASIGLMHPPRA